ncbi:hypothetical protein IKG33_02250 [Candidatus Saccharibacteria bacterium]|nr:hypothetical protein [Candidatus Saccharibacteria bacterium]
MKDITAKDVRLAIKNGLTPDELAEEYGLSLDQLKSRIRAIYKEGKGTKAQQIWGELEANRKKAHCRTKRKAPTVVEGTPKTIEPEEIQEQPEAESLQDLKGKEATLSAEVMKLESDHKELSGQHRDCIHALRELQTRIDNVRKELIACNQSYNEIASKADSIATEMNTISTLRREKVVVLERVRQEILEKSMIAVYVYKDGIIEAPENPDVALNDDGYQELKETIAEREECLDLRVRDVITLARLLKICESFDALTLVCDVPELEIAFWAIRNN